MPPPPSFFVPSPKTAAAHMLRMAARDGAVVMPYPPHTWMALPLRLAWPGALQTWLRRRISVALRDAGRLAQGDKQRPARRSE